MDGVLIIDKPAGPTSHDVVARVRHALMERRVGHTGTLDPFATGVLVVLVGRATRLAQFLGNAEKEYEAVVRFGYATDTGDGTGKPQPYVREATAMDAATLTEQRIEEALAGLSGEIEQAPPMYSAKKVKGRKLYEMARKGEVVERAAVRVRIHELEAVRRDGAMLRRNRDSTCDLSIRVVCSAGTYIRTLAETIGERLGTPAHLAELRRTRAGDFHLEQAITLDQLNELGQAGVVAGRLLSPDAALSRLPFMHLNNREAERARHGATVRAPTESAAEWQPNQRVRLRDEDGELIGVGTYDAGKGGVVPRVVLATAK